MNRVFRGITATLAVILAGMVGACGDVRTAELDLIVVEPAIRMVSLRNSRPLSLQDTLALHFIHDLKIKNGQIAVVDAEDRLVLLNRDLVVQRVLGRSGSGPGELKRPGGIQFWGDGIVIADRGNGRAVYWSTDGVERWTRPIPVSDGFNLALGLSGALYLPVMADRHYLNLVDTAGIERPWAARPVAWKPESGIPESVVAHIAVRHFVAITPGDTVHVLDGMTGEFLKYSPDGRLVLHKRLPPSLRERVLADKGVTVTGRADGGSVTYRPAFHDFEVTEDGALLAVLSPGGTLGNLKAFLIDPATLRRSRDPCGARRVAG